MKYISFLIVILSTSWVNVALSKQIEPGNLVAQGSLCVGMDCVNGESFGSDVLRLKENNLRIRFWDSNHLSADLQTFSLVANDSANGGNHYFSFDHSLITPVLGDGITDGYDSEGVLRIIELDEQVYKFSESPSGGFVPSWEYSNTPLLKFIKSADPLSNFQAALILGQDSEVVDGALTVGNETLLRQIKNVAQGVNDTDILITGLINHYDPVSDQKLILQKVEESINALAAELTQLENWLAIAEKLDSDGDGINDYKDTDDDNDGIPDDIERGDFNNDGIDDSQQAEETVESFGAGAFSFAYMFLALLAIRQRSLVIVLTFFSLSFTAQAQAYSDECLTWSMDEPANCFYLGVGIGASDLLEGSESDAWQKKQAEQMNMSIFFGRHLTEDWAMEFGYSKLGKNEFRHNNPAITNIESIDYQAKFLSLVGNLWQVNNRFLISANAGVAWLDASASSGLEIEQSQAVEGVFGLRGDWQVYNGWHTQMQLNHYMNTANTVNLTLVYNFGEESAKRERTSNAVKESSAEKEIAEESILIAESQLTTKSLDQQCQILSGVLLSVYFDPRSVQLNAPERERLMQWLSSLNNKEHLNLVLEGSSDRKGTALNNLKFSKLRAQNVANVLLENGFSNNNLSIDGNGEFGLVSDQAELNRRVEIWVQSDRTCST